MLIALRIILNNFNLNLILNLEKNYYFLLFFAFILKRAQYPFNLWLPLAIVAPMPVSSLVHSSTLVVVGLYFLFRFYIFINLNILFYFSILTILFYGFNIVLRLDFKKIIALSTINHISLIMIFI